MASSAPNISAGPVVPGVPALRWVGGIGEAACTGSTLTMTAGAKTDWFNDPAGPTRLASAPALIFDCEAGLDFQLSAHVAVDFGATFDAGVLFVHQSTEDYAKLCFEFSPEGEPTVVSVVTRATSDDANGPGIDGRSVHLRVSRFGTTFAFHHSADGQVWKLKRLFSLRDSAQPTSVGFLSQSPTGSGCLSSFDSITLSADTLLDARDGS